MYTLRQYLTTLSDTHGLTRTLGQIDVCRDQTGRMCYTAGNSAIVFRIRHKGRIRSLRCYMHHPRHLAEIYGDRLLKKELFIYTSPASGVWVDAVLGDWIEGVTLHEAVAEAAGAGDRARLRRFAAAFDRMAAALTADDWAHGDLKPENIIADPAGRLHLIDFDAVFLPDFAGQSSPELGTAAYQHPARTVRDFDASLDDYPAALISTALHALALDPALYTRYAEADGLLFTPQKIRTDAALCEALGLFEQAGLAAQYRIARLLYAPSLRLAGLPQLLAHAAQTEDAVERASASGIAGKAGTTMTGMAETRRAGAGRTAGVTGTAERSGTAGRMAGITGTAERSGTAGIVGRTDSAGTAGKTRTAKTEEITGPARARAIAGTVERRDSAGTAGTAERRRIKEIEETAGAAKAAESAVIAGTTGTEESAVTAGKADGDSGAADRSTVVAVPEGTELFVENGLWGFRTPQRVVVPPLYDCGFDFSEGLAAVRLGQTWHYIDGAGRTRISCPECEAVKPFRNGRARIISGGRRREIDRAGREFDI